MGQPRPAEVIRAILDEDKEALKAMGKVGGKKAGMLSRQRADVRAGDEARRAEYEMQRLADARAHAEATRPGWDDTYAPGPHE